MAISMCMWFANATIEKPTRDTVKFENALSKLIQNVNRQFPRHINECGYHLMRSRALTVPQQIACP